MTRKLGKSLTCGATMLRLRCGVWIEEISKEIIQVVKSEPDEVDQLEVATDVIRACKRDEFKDAKAVIEVAYLQSHRVWIVSP